MRTGNDQFQLAFGNLGIIRVEDEFAILET